MDLARVLALKRGQEVNELMRFVPATGITIRTVNKLLQNEMPVGMRAEFSFRQRQAKVLHVTVKIAYYHALFGLLRQDDTSPPAWCIMKSLGGLFEGSQKSSRI